MADCAQAIQSIGTYEFVIRGNVTTEAEFNANVEWVVGKDSNDTAIMGAKPDAVTWTKVKADMDKQDAFASQKKINEANREIETLVGTRTRMMQSKLKNVEQLEVSKTDDSKSNFLEVQNQNND